MDREGNKSHREKLLSVTAKDADVDDVLKVLHALQVTCQSRPLVETEELGKTFAKFLIALKNYTVFHALERKKPSAKRLLWMCDKFFSYLQLRSLTLQELVKVSLVTETGAAHTVS